MRPIRITSDLKLYVFGRRIHHGLYGAWRIATGLALVAHDWKDRPWPLRDRER